MDAEELLVRTPLPAQDDENGWDRLDQSARDLLPATLTLTLPVARATPEGLTVPLALTPMGGPVGPYRRWHYELTGPVPVPGHPGHPDLVLLSTHAEHGTVQRVEVQHGPPGPGLRAALASGLTKTWAQPNHRRVIALLRLHRGAAAMVHEARSVNVVTGSAAFADLIRWLNAAVVTVAATSPTLSREEATLAAGLERGWAGTASDLLDTLPALTATPAPR